MLSHILFSVYLLKYYLLMLLPTHYFFALCALIKCHRHSMGPYRNAAVILKRFSHEQRLVIRKEITYRVPAQPAISLGFTTSRNTLMLLKKANSNRDISLL